MNDLATSRSICAETVPHMVKEKEFEVKTVPGDPDEHSNKVYFLYSAGLVKIGTTNRVMRRFSEIKTSSPLPSQVVMLIPGGRLTEEYLHFIFNEYHVRGEWFRLGQRMRDAISRLAPDFCQQWLEEEEQAHRDWIANEAERLGLLPSHSEVVR